MTYDRAAFLAWNAANRRARDEYHRGEGIPTDYTAAERKNAANRRYRARQKENRP